MVGHTGQINGFASVLAYLPQHDITLVALANDDTFDARTFGRRLAAIALGRPYPLVEPASRTDQQLRALVGTYGDDPATARTLTLEDGVLRMRRGDRPALPMQMTPDDHLHLAPDELSYFVPARGADDRVERLDYYEDGDGPPRALARH
jgi:hypothetical protein